VTLPKLVDIDVLNTDIKTVLENDPNYLELLENIDKALEEVEPYPESVHG